MNNLKDSFIDEMVLHFKKEINEFPNLENQKYEDIKCCIPGCSYSCTVLCYNFGCTGGGCSRGCSESCSEDSAE